MREARFDPIAQRQMEIRTAFGFVLVLAVLVEDFGGIRGAFEAIRAGSAAKDSDEDKCQKRTLHRA